MRVSHEIKWKPTQPLLKLLTVACLFLPHQSFSGPEDLDSDLFLDGDALANVLTGALLERHDVRKLREDPLVFGVMGRLYTGSEFRPQSDPKRVALHQWLIDQPLFSVQPHQFLEKAIEIESGRAYRGLTLAWDVLRAEWSNSEERNTFPHILRLADITGELELFRRNQLEKPRPLTNPPIYRPFGRKTSTIRGDNFSAWYHFMGTALHSFMASNSRLQTIPGWLKTRFLVWLEERVLHDEFVDSQKRINIDLAGVKFGRKLAANFKRFSSKEEFFSSTESRVQSYLRSAPEVYGPQWRLRLGQAPADYGTNSFSGDTETLMGRFRRIQNLLKDPASNLDALVVVALTDPSSTYRKMARSGLKVVSVDALVESLIASKFGDDELLEIFSELPANLEASEKLYDFARTLYRELSAAGGGRRGSIASVLKFLLKLPDNGLSLEIVRSSFGTKDPREIGLMFELLGRMTNPESRDLMILLVNTVAKECSNASGRKLAEWIPTVNQGIRSILKRGDVNQVEELNKFAKISFSVRSAMNRLLGMTFPALGFGLASVVPDDFSVVFGLLGAYGIVGPLFVGPDTWLKYRDLKQIRNYAQDAIQKLVAERPGVGANSCSSVVVGDSDETADGSQ